MTGAPDSPTQARKEPIIALECPWCSYKGMRFMGGIRKANLFSRGRGQRERFVLECNAPRRGNGWTCDGLKLSRHRLVLAALSAVQPR